MDWLKYIVAILSGLATAIPLVVALIQNVQKAIKEKNWDKLLDTVMSLMTEAESKFNTGTERKEWVLMMIKASSDSINYDVNLDSVSELIDALCDMSKAVNGEKELVVADS